MVNPLFAGISGLFAGAVADRLPLVAFCVAGAANEGTARMSGMIMGTPSRGAFDAPSIGPGGIFQMDFRRRAAAPVIDLGAAGNP